MFCHSLCEVQCCQLFLMESRSSPLKKLLDVTTCKFAYCIFFQLLSSHPYGSESTSHFKNVSRPSYRLWRHQGVVTYVFSQAADWSGGTHCCSSPLTPHSLSREPQPCECTFTEKYRQLSFSCR